MTSVMLTLGLNLFVPEVFVFNHVVAFQDHLKIVVVVGLEAKLRQRSFLNCRVVVFRSAQITTALATDVESLLGGDLRQVHVAHN